jgi:hypothetical protein
MTVSGWILRENLRPVAEMLGRAAGAETEPDGHELGA